VHAPLFCFKKLKHWGMLFQIIGLALFFAMVEFVFKKKLNIEISLQKQAMFVAAVFIIKLYLFF
jgi:hypothetical protein